METTKTRTIWHHPWVVLALFLALPVAVFWRPLFFYMGDDWTALIHMVEYPFGQYLMVPDGEQWFPLFHLIYYGLVKMAGERYSLLVMVNCLGTGANAFLLYLFFRRHWHAGLALSLSLFYAGAALHHAIAWNGFYVGYLLSLGFFLGALLVTDSYLSRPSTGRLWTIGLLSGLSLLAHNYPLSGLMALPLYVLLMGPGDARRPFWSVTAVMGVVYLLFAGGYLLCAGVHAATSHNLRIFAGLPGPGYLVHLFFGALLSPFLYLFWGHYHFPVLAFVAGIGLLALSLGVIWRWGGPREKRLALWALLANSLPFLLVSLTRYQRSVNQAFVARYGIFTLIGALLLVGTAWSLMAARASRKPLFHSLALLLLAVMVYGQIQSLPRWQEKYVEISHAAWKCYAYLSSAGAAPAHVPPEEFRKFCPTAHPTITPGQAMAIRRFLHGLPENQGAGGEAWSRPPSPGVPVIPRGD